MDLSSMAWEVSSCRQCTQWCRIRSAARQYRSQQLFSKVIREGLHSWVHMKYQSTLLVVLDPIVFRLVVSWVCRLMDSASFDTLVVAIISPTSSPNHRKVYIPVGGGPTFEYYTKLAHFCGCRCRCFICCWMGFRCSTDWIYEAHFFKSFRPLERRFEKLPNDAHSIILVQVLV